MTIPVSSTTAPGDLITQVGQVQFGRLLLGSGTNAGWFDLIGWRDAPEVTLSDTPRPQAHGSYAGDVWGESKAVSFVARIDTTEADRMADVATLERYLPIDGVEQPLVVHDGLSATMRMGRVTVRQVPQPWDFQHSRVLDVQVQWTCADPRRYSLTPQSVTVGLGTATGGLAYPLAYPLAYGTSVGGSATVTNDGNTPAPLTATFTGPLTNPVLVADTGWRMGFRIVLAAGETLVVDTASGSALLNGSTDRLYTIDPTASPLERALLAPGPTTLSLSAAAGSGSVSANYRHAYL